MIPKRTLIAALLIICVLFAGCMSVFPARSPKGPRELTEPSWRLVSYFDGNRTMVPVRPQTNISLKFDEKGNLSGSVYGCVRYSGRYTTLGETITITNITVVHESRCQLSQEAVETENSYLSFLQKAPRFNINEDKLVFGYYDAQRYLVFSRA
jgi:heat shock protein HslJ